MSIDWQRKLTRYWLLCACIYLSGCDLIRGDAHRYTHGQTIPNARISIELPEPRTIAQLYPSYIEAASRGGFPHSRGLTGPRPLEQMLSENGVISGVRFAEQPNIQSAFQRQLAFLSHFNAVDEPVKTKQVATSITFIFERDNLGSFTKEEWLEFYAFYDEILPDVFPDADIQIMEIRHPAVFTDYEILLQIQEETDIEIPEKYLVTPEDA